MSDLEDGDVIHASSKRTVTNGSLPASRRPWLSDNMEADGLPAFHKQLRSTHKRRYPEDSDSILADKEPKRAHLQRSARESTETKRKRKSKRSKNRPKVIAQSIDTDDSGDELAIAPQSTRTVREGKKHSKQLNMPEAAPQTSRNNVREGIKKHTKPRRDAFLFEHSEMFLPLLPERNYISKLQDSSETVRDVEVSQPKGVTATMKPYQLDGLRFLVKMYQNGMPAILGDEMGLGKTLQTLSLFQWIEENEPSKGEARPYLVVCPLSVLTSWMNEAKKWTPNLAAHRMHGPKAERQLLQQQLKSKSVKVNLVVTTYEAFQAEQNWFQRAFAWRYLVLDEGHKIKNDQTSISRSLQGISAKYRLLVTGTPLQNDLAEAWALFHWLFPEVFTSETQSLFKQSFNLTRGQVSTDVMDNVRHLLEIIMLRRLKSSEGVDLGLPPKEEVTLFVPMTPYQREWYLQLLTRIDRATLQDVFQDAKAKEVSDLAEEAEVTASLGDAHSLINSNDNNSTTSEDAKTQGQWKKLMNLVMQLRKVCSHPYLIPGAQPEPYELSDAVRRTSGKFIVLDKLVTELVIGKQKKILIFSGFTHVLDLVEDLLTMQGANTTDGPYKYLRLDGSTARAKRNLGIRMFNDMESDFRVMLISTRAGGLGINLTSANTVVFIDEDWNPQVTLQAEARAHRIGQTQKVTVYKLCTKGTVEEQMIGRIQKKLYLSTKVTESMRNLHTSKQKRKSKSNAIEEVDDNDEPQLGSSQLKALLRRGAQALSGPDIDTEKMLGWDWQTILEECKDRPMDTQELDENKWLNQIEKVETAVFEGRKWQREKKKEATGLVVDLVRSDRRLGKHTTVMIDGYAVDKMSTLCGDWEAVPTLAGKDPRLASPKRVKKAELQHQSHCQACWDGGELILCSGCPRAYHIECLDHDYQAKATGKMNFYCPQHACWDCKQKTASVGGLIYRCRWCENGFCEDCLDWDNTKLLGENIPEFEALQHHTNQAWFIECASCQSGRIEWIQEREAEYERQQLEEELKRQQFEDDVKRQHLVDGFQRQQLDDSLGGFGDNTLLTYASSANSTAQSEAATPRSVMDKQSVLYGHPLLKEQRPPTSVSAGTSGMITPSDDIIFIKEVSKQKPYTTMADGLTGTKTLMKAQQGGFQKFKVNSNQAE